MKDFDQKIGWSIIRSSIDNQNNPGHNIVNIFTLMTSFKLDHVKKQVYHYWILVNGDRIQGYSME